MRIHKEQSGVAPLAVLLFAVLFGIIGYSGYRVYQISKDGPDASSESTTQTSENKPKDKSPIPEGYVAYKNEELGFKLAHPKDWGKIRVEDARMLKTDTSGLKADRGQRWLIKFSGQPAATLGLTSKDWEADAGRGGMCNIADGSSHKTIPTPVNESGEGYTNKLLAKSEKYYITEIAGIVYCSNVTLNIDYIFQNNTDYLTLKFTYNVYDFADDREREYNDYLANSAKYVPRNIVDTVTEIAESIEDI